MFLPRNDKSLRPSKDKSLRHYGSRAIETFGFKTEKSLKHANNLTDGELLSKIDAKQRATAGAATGVALNGVASGVFPPFSRYQHPSTAGSSELGVACVDYRRSMEELKLRMIGNPNPKTLCETSKIRKCIRNISIGFSLKTILTVLSAGIVGGDSMVEAFSPSSRTRATSSIQ